MSNRSRVPSSGACSQPAGRADAGRPCPAAAQARKSAQAPSGFVAPAASDSGAAGNSACPRFLRALARRCCRKSVRGVSAFERGTVHPITLTAVLGLVVVPDGPAESGASPGKGCVTHGHLHLCSQRRNPLMRSCGPNAYLFF